MQTHYLVPYLFILTRFYRGVLFPTLQYRASRTKRAVRDWGKRKSVVEECDIQYQTRYIGYKNVPVGRNGMQRLWEIPYSPCHSMYLNRLCSYIPLCRIRQLIRSLYFMLLHNLGYMRHDRSHLVSRLLLWQDNFLLHETASTTFTSLIFYFLAL